MSSKPWYAWFPADYRAKTTHLNFTECGAYRRLLDAYYERRGPLPCDTIALYRITGAVDDSEKRAIDKTSKEFFIQRDGMLFHERAEDQISKETALHKKWSEAGREGGLKSSQARLEASLKPPLKPASTIPHPHSHSSPHPRKPKKLLSGSAPDAFVRFWDAYPKKEAKKNAIRAWNSLSPNEETQARILTAIEIRKHTEQWALGFVPLPATYLNGSRWEDEVEEPKRQKQQNWRATERAIEAKGRSLGMMARAGESWSQYADRIEERIEHE